MKHPRLEKKPRIIFSKEAYFSMFEYCRQSPGEITGFGSVNEVAEGLYVDEVYIMPQEVTGGHCEIDGKTLVDFMEWCKQNDREDLPPKARLWWHSHNNFGVFRSGTDQATCEMLIGGLPYLLCIVANKMGDAEVTLHYPKPRLTISGLKIEQTGDLLMLREVIKAEVAEKVTEKRFHIVQGNTDITQLPSRTPAVHEPTTLFTDDQLVEIGRRAKAGEPEDRKCAYCFRDIPMDRLSVYPNSTWCGNLQCEDQAILEGFSG